MDCGNDWNLGWFSYFTKMRKISIYHSQGNYMKSLNEIKDLVESNQSEQAIMAAQLDDCSKAVALDLAGHKEKAQEIVSALDPSEKEKGLENFYETEVEHLFLSENLETVER
jgi:hypothetical protein